MSTAPELDLRAELQQSIRADFAWHYRVIPASITGGERSFLIASDQQLALVQEELCALFGEEVTLIPEDPDLIQRMLARNYRKLVNEKTVELDSKTDFVDRVIQEANQLGSSDIHIETYDDKARIRIRIDGHLIERFSLDKNDYPELVNKIKIRSNLDISEKRLPQDGRIQYEDFDIRVSILPTLHGEKIVLRILGKDASAIDIQQLGMSDVDLRNYLEGIKRPTGIVLISGPTGSGKTTTLYATLKLLNSEERNILTVEDPVEYTLDGINQVQLKENIGLTFAAALRSFLRQDPDVIMLGEIRDSETAQMAIRAALTGHLVLSTIHTNSAWGTVSRLIDMDIPPFLVANTLNTSVAQRLVRKLCTNCKQKQPSDKSIWPRNLAESQIPPFHYLNVGCDTCHYTGYKGRRAIYEVIPVDSGIADAIKQNEMRIEEELTSRGVVSLAEQALNLIKEGESSLEECYSLLTDL